MSKPDQDPANGPWFHYMEQQAEQDRKAKFLGDEELGCFAHERSWESVSLQQVLSCLLGDWLCIAAKQPCTVF